MELSPMVILFGDLDAFEGKFFPGAFFIIIQKITFFFIASFAPQTGHADHPGSLLQSLHIHPVQGIAPYTDLITFPLAKTINGNQQKKKNDEPHSLVSLIEKLRAVSYKPQALKLLFINAKMNCLCAQN